MPEVTCELMVESRLELNSPEPQPGIIVMILGYLCFSGNPFVARTHAENILARCPAEVWSDQGDNRVGQRRDL